MRQHRRRLSEVERRFLVTMRSAFHNGASTALSDTHRGSDGLKPSPTPSYVGDPTPVVRNRLRYELGDTPSARRNVRLIVSDDPNPARRATAS